MWQTLCYYGALALESVLGVFGVRLYEEPHYDAIDRVADRVEIRRYAHRLAAEVQLAVAGEAGRNEAFRLLFAYIAGANRASGLGNRKIAMTVPVEVRDKELVAITVPVQTSETNGTTLMRFFLPAKYSAVDDQVKFAGSNPREVANRQSTRSPAQRRMIGNRQVDLQHFHDRSDQAFALAKRQSKYGA